MPPTYLPWFREQQWQGCLVSWMRNQGEGRGILLGVCEVRRPGSPETTVYSQLEILDADSGRVILVDTWRARPLDG